MWKDSITFAATCQKQTWREKSVPQSRVATRQQSPNAQAEIPFEERAPSTPKLQHMSRYPRNSRVSSDGETNCKYRRGLCTTASGGPLPHCPSAQRVSKRKDYRPKIKSKSLSLGRNLDFLSYWWVVEWLLQDAISVPVSPHLFAILHGCELSFHFCWRQEGYTDQKLHTLSNLKLCILRQQKCKNIF